MATIPRGMRTSGAALLGLMLATAGLLTIILLDGSPALAQSADLEPASADPGFGTGSDAPGGGLAGDDASGRQVAELPASADADSELRYGLGAPLGTETLAPPLAVPGPAPAGTEGRSPAGRGPDITPEWAYARVEEQTRDDGLAPAEQGPGNDAMPSTVDGLPVASSTSTGQLTMAAAAARDDDPQAQRGTDVTVEGQPRSRSVFLGVQPERLVTALRDARNPVTVKYGQQSYTFDGPVTFYLPIPEGVETDLRVSPESFVWKGATWKPHWYAGEHRQERYFVSSRPEAFVPLLETWGEPSIVVRYQVDQYDTPPGTAVEAQILPVASDQPDRRLRGVTVTVAEGGGGPTTTLTGGNGDVKAAYRRDHLVTVDPVVRREPAGGSRPGTELWTPSRVIRVDANGDRHDIPLPPHGGGRPYFTWSPSPGDSVRIVYERQ